MKSNSKRGSLIEDIYMENVKVKKGGEFGIHLEGLPDSPLRIVWMKDVEIDSVENCYEMDYFENLNLINFYCNGALIELDQ